MLRFSFIFLLLFLFCQLIGSFVKLLRASQAQTQNFRRKYNKNNNNFSMHFAWNRRANLRFVFCFVPVVWLDAFWVTIYGKSVDFEYFATGLHDATEPNMGE